MNKLVLLAGAALLAACSQKAGEAAAPETAASDTMPVDAGASPAAAAAGGVPGVYDVVRADGTKLVATLNADGTFARDFGDHVEKGTWVSKGDQTCFDPEGDAPESCNTRSPLAADGTFTSTDPKGAVAKVTPRS